MPIDSQLEKILIKWSDWCDQKPQLLRQLKGGLTNHSFLVQSSSQQYVLRINAQNSNALDLDRDVEVRALTHAAEVGIGARLIHCDPGRQYLVTEYIEGRQWCAEDIHIEGGVEQLATLLKAIHHLEPVNKTLNIREKAASYWCAIADHSDWGLHEWALQLKKLEPEIQAHISQAEEKRPCLCFCHNDLLAENLLLDNLLLDSHSHLYAIDWEYAAMGDAYFDLAVIVEGHALNDAVAERLLRSYAGLSSNENLPKRHRQRLYHNRVIYRYLTMLWYAVKHSSQALDDTGTVSGESLLDKQLASLTALLTMGDS